MKDQNLKGIGILKFKALYKAGFIQRFITIQVITMILYNLDYIVYTAIM